MEQKKKKIPVGLSNYQEMKTEKYYVVDKSLMIKEFLDSGAKVTLITRPRRFGKTLNMSMLAEFFDYTKDSRMIFEDTAITQTAYANEINQYPTIFLSFANCKGNEENIKINIYYVLRKKMGEYLALLDNVKLDKDFVNRYQMIYDSLAKEEDFARVQFSIMLMCELLYKISGRRIMLFIDEYDTPFIEAHVNNCYDELHGALAGMLSSALKDNPYLQYAMLTGIQRVAKENTPQADFSLFLGLNNLKVHTVASSNYASYFGFVEEEVKAMLEYYGLPYSDAVKAMYDGYHIGDEDIYNPWSVINYVSEKQLAPYWVNVSSSGMIKKAMEEADAEFHAQYETLIRTRKLETVVDLQTSFYEYSSNASLWGLFVNAGYLTITGVDDGLYSLVVPNEEVMEAFKTLTLDYMKKDPDGFTKMMRGLTRKNPQMFLENYRKFLLKTTSYHDLINENSYHTLLLGMCACLYADYEVKSNQEAGKGRYDIILQCKTNKYPSYIIELKYLKKEEYEKRPELLQEKCKEAVEQIEANRYDIAISGNVIYIALAHSGKDVEMVWKETMK
ncbi:MAG: AAA family ATPase [Clostridium sp.]|nr:AAA family ATPase [Erysipelotrichaceae bacterium 66202529]